MTNPLDESAKAAADQWELHRFTTRDNGMAARHITHVRRTAGPHRRIRERKHPWQGMTATSASSTGARSRTR